VVRFPLQSQWKRAITPPIQPEKCRNTTRNRNGNSNQRGAHSSGVRRPSYSCGMPTRITVGAVLRRTVSDTGHLFDLHNRRRLLVRVAIFGLAVLLFWRLWGQDRVVDELRWPVVFFAAFGAVALGSLLINLISTPFRLAREAEAAAEQRKADAEIEAAALRAKVALLEGRKTDLEFELRDYRLVVRNKGSDTAKLRAQISIYGRQAFPSVQEGAVYDGFWERSQGSLTSILPELQDSILLGGLDVSPSPIPKAAVSFIFFDPITQKSKAIPETYALETAAKRPALFLEIIVSSEGGVPGRPLVHRVVLSESGVYPF
jgi:hypothetical protein